MLVHNWLIIFYTNLVRERLICSLFSWIKPMKIFLYQCTTDIPIKPINQPINRYRPINRIGKSQKSQYRIGIGSADYKGLYRLIGFTYYSYFCRHEKSQNWVKLEYSSYSLNVNFLSHQKSFQIKRCFHLRMG